MNQLTRGRILKPHRRQRWNFPRKQQLVAMRELTKCPGYPASIIFIPFVVSAIRLSFPGRHRWSPLAKVRSRRVAFDIRWCCPDTTGSCLWCCPDTTGFCLCCCPHLDSEQKMNIVFSPTSIYQEFMFSTRYIRWFRFVLTSQPKPEALQ